MNTVEVMLVMTCAVLASKIISEHVQKISLPLIQIVLGFILATLIPTVDYKFDPNVFLLVFIAPLLFDDGFEMDKYALWQLKRPILSLAIGLVFVTTLILGFVLHLIAPSIPLAVAFAFAAALGPTDAVAVGSLSRRISLTDRQKNLLQGEWLLNDASGIVAFQFALIFVTTGAFSLVSATVSFVVEFFGGIIAGALCMLIRSLIMRYVNNMGSEDSVFKVAFELITPFITYLVAELFGVSGILAVVTAGIIYSLSSTRSRFDSAETATISSNTWSLLIFLLNGLVFVMLGVLFVQALPTVWLDPDISNLWIILLVVASTLILYAVRFLWLSFFKTTNDTADDGAIATELVSRVGQAVGGAFDNLSGGPSSPSPSEPRPSGSDATPVASGKDAPPVKPASLRIADKDLSIVEGLTSSKRASDDETVSKGTDSGAAGLALEERAAATAETEGATEAAESAGVVEVAGAAGVVGAAGITSASATVGTEETSGVAESAGTPGAVAAGETSCSGDGVASTGAEGVGDAGGAGAAGITSASATVGTEETSGAAESAGTPGAAAAGETSRSGDGMASAGTEGVGGAGGAGVAGGAEDVGGAGSAEDAGRAESDAETKAHRAERKQLRRKKLKSNLLLTFAGAKGVVTFAIILSLPLTVSGVAFPKRSLLIFLSAGVILVTLLVANFVVPRFATTRGAVERQEEKMAQTRLDIISKVTLYLTQRMTDENRAATNLVLLEYDRQAAYLREYAISEDDKNISHRLRISILQLERQNAFHLIDIGEVSPFSGYRYLWSLEKTLAEMRRVSVARAEIKAAYGWAMHFWRLMKERRQVKEAGGTVIKNYPSWSEVLNNFRATQNSQMMKVRKLNGKFVVEKLDQKLHDLPHIDERERKELVRQAALYRDRVAVDATRTNRRSFSAEAENRANELQEQREEIEMRALQFERNEIHRLFEADKISTEELRELMSEVSLRQIDVGN